MEHVSYLLHLSQDNTAGEASYISAVRQFLIFMFLDSTDMIDEILVPLIQ